MAEIYIAGKIHSQEVPIAEFASELEGRGHEVLEKWWAAPPLPTPYLDYLDTSAPAAETMLNAAYESDVFILFPGATILGAAVELGAATASLRDRPEKEVLVVNPNSARQSVFYAHPGVIAVCSLAAIRQRSWY